MFSLSSGGAIGTDIMTTTMPLYSTAKLLFAEQILEKTECYRVVTVVHGTSLDLHVAAAIWGHTVSVRVSRVYRSRLAG